MNSEANGNGPAVTLHDKHDEHGDDELQFGWLNIRPKQAQMLKKPVVFLVIVVSLTSSQGKINGHIIHSIDPRCTHTPNNRTGGKQKNLHKLNICTV